MPALFPAFETQSAGLDPTEINGRALFDLAEELHEVSKNLGLTPFMDFYDERDMAEQYADPDETDLNSLPPMQWHAATDGLKTIRGLRDYLTTDSEDAADHQAVIQDLDDIEKQLIIAEKRNIGFHWLLDI